MAGALVIFFALLWQMPGGWGGIATAGEAAGKFRIFDFDPSLTTPNMTFRAGLIGGMFLTAATHGTDQLTVQRLLTARLLLLQGRSRPFIAIALWQHLLRQLLHRGNGLPGTVAWWELASSMTLLVAGFLFTTWLSGKIYRTGILMYGKKVNYKELSKWLFYRV